MGKLYYTTAIQSTDGAECRHGRKIVALDVRMLHHGTVIIFLT